MATIPNICYIPSTNNPENKKVVEYITEGFLLNSNPNVIHINSEDTLMEVCANLSGLPVTWFKDPFVREAREVPDWMYKDEYMYSGDEFLTMWDDLPDWLLSKKDEPDFSFKFVGDYEVDITVRTKRACEEFKSYLEEMSLLENNVEEAEVICYAETHSVDDYFLEVRQILQEANPQWMSHRLDSRLKDLNGYGLTAIISTASIEPQLLENTVFWVEKSNTVSQDLLEKADVVIDFSELNYPALKDEIIRLTTNHINTYKHEECI